MRAGPRVCYHLSKAMIRKYLPESTEQLIHWYERYVSPFALIAGFLLDSFILLDRVDVLLGNILLLSYLLLVGGGIVVLNVVESGRVRNRFMLAIAPFAPVVIQFFFGGLFSGYLSLYSRSAGIALSWVFVIVLAVLLVGNERFRTLYLRLPFQLSIYFTALFSFLIFFLPLVFKSIGTHMFIFSGITSVLLISAFLYILKQLMPERVQENWKPTVRSLVAIFLVFNVLYFSNLIPPLPLALKEAGVYHSVERVGDGYRLTYEPQHWYVRYLNRPATVHSVSGGKIYVFSAVFAPSGLSTVIRHQWQYFDPAADRWVTKSDVRFTIHGGRDGGFRGYSEKRDPEAGSWRVNVLTAQGQIIGRTGFTVIAASGTPVLEERIR